MYFSEANQYCGMTFLLHLNKKDTREILYHSFLLRIHWLYKTPSQDHFLQVNTPLKKGKFFVSALNMDNYPENT